MSELVLSYLALAARDVGAACRFLEGSLDLVRNDLEVGLRKVPFFGVGRAAVAVFELDDPYLEEPRNPGVHHMALSAQDPHGYADLHTMTIQSEGTGPAGLAYVSVDPSVTCGIRTRFIQPLKLPSQPGIINRIDHLGIVSRNTNEVRKVFVESLSCPLESTETDIELQNITESFVSDKYGAVYHARTPEIVGGLHAVFINVGDCELEVMMDYDSKLSPLKDLGHKKGDTKSDQSAIANFVAKRGPGLAHVAFATKDIDALLNKLSGDGWQLIDPTGRPGGRGSRIGFVHPNNFGGGLLIHFVQPRTPDKQASVCRSPRT